MAEPMVWLPPVVPPKRKGFRAFVGKHDALFTVLGALIVFTGFFFKEGVRENSKDLSSSLNAAQSTYGIQNTLADVEESLHPVVTSDLVKVVSEVFKINPHSNTTLEDYVSSAAEMIVKKNNTQLKMKTAISLLKYLKHPSSELNDLGTKVKTYRFECASNVMSNVSHVAKLAQFPPEEPPEGAKVRRLILGVAFEQMNDCKRTLNQRQEAAAEYMDQMLIEAEEQSTLNEIKLKRVTYLTYALFALGWGLGLVGKLAKLPALGGGGGGD